MWFRAGRQEGPRRRRVDPEHELRELLRAQRGGDEELVELGLRLRRLLRVSSPPAADPAFRSRLRASLMVEARQQRSQRRGRPWGFLFGAGMGLAGVAMLSAALAYVVILPRTDTTVTVRATVAGHHQVPVTQAIQLSFNLPMDEPDVDQGLKVTPALAYHTQWPDDQTLVIAPSHQLVPNVSYVVSIARTAARSRNDGFPLSNIVVPFGTLSSSGGSGLEPPSVVSTTVAGVSTGPASLSYAGDGELFLLAQSGLEVGGTPAPTPTTTPTTSSPSTSPADSPPSAQGAPSAPLAAAPASSTGLIYGLYKQPQLVTSGAVSMALSPDSQNVAYWAKASTGGYVLEVAPLSGGGQPLALATAQESDPTVYWLNDATMLFSQGGDLYQANLSGLVTQVFPMVQLNLTGNFSLSPNDQALFTHAGAAGTPTVYDLQTGGTEVLQGLQGNPTWSSSSGDLAFVARRADRYTIEVADGFGADPSTLLTAPAGATLAQLSFDPSGRFIAYQLTEQGSSGELGAVDVDSGRSAALTARQGMEDPAWSPYGSQLAALQRVPGSSNLQVVEFQLSSSGGLPQSSQAGDQAEQTAAALAALQVQGSSAGEQKAEGMLAPSAQVPQSALFPGHFDRFYTVSSAPTSASGSSYLVELELVQDATATSPPEYLEEQVTVDVDLTTPAVQSITDSLLTPVPGGPLIVGSSAVPAANGAVVFSLQFDADLDPATVGAQSIEVTDQGVALTGLSFSYSPDQRTVTVTTPPLSGGELVLTVSAPLADVNHHQIAAPFQLSLPVPATPFTS